MPGGPQESMMIQYASETGAIEVDRSPCFKTKLEAEAYEVRMRAERKLPEGWVVFRVKHPKDEAGWYVGKKPKFVETMRWYHYFLVTLGFVLVYQSLMMWLWFKFPQYDTYFLRYSLSNADAIEYSAWFLAILGMYLMEVRFAQFRKQAALKEKQMRAKFEEQLKAYGEGFRIFGDALKESGATKDDLKGFFLWMKRMGNEPAMQDMSNQMKGYGYDIKSMEPALNRILRIYHENHKNIEQTLGFVEQMLPFMPALKELYGKKLERAKDLTDAEKKELIKSIIRVRDR